MKIVIISTMNGFPWGGSEELWWHTALYAKKNGHDVRAVVFNNKPTHQKIKYLQQQGIPVDLVGERKEVTKPLLKKIVRKFFKKSFPFEYRDRFSFIHSYHPDFILLSQGGTTDIVYYDDLKIFFLTASVPYYILNQHHVEHGILLPEQKDFLRTFVLKCRKIFFVAERNKEVLERQLAKRFANAFTVKNPVNLDEKTIVEWPNKQVPHFAVVARFDVAYKGQDILLQTLATTRWSDRDFVVNLFGKGPDEKYLSKLITFYHLEKKVFIKGHAENIRALWAENQVLIIPSVSEGTPLSAVEAMLCGRPCVLTDVGDCAALLADGQNGWIAYAPSVKALDEALERAWRQQGNWQQMGLAAHQTAKNFVEEDPGKAFFERMLNE